jgi:GcrA cell cycle regulator
VRVGRVTECCWPVGSPGTRAFRFCDDPTLPGASYCDAHDRVAYIRPRGHAAPLAGTGAELAGAP